MENISGGHCICHCSKEPTVNLVLSSKDECEGWCRGTGHGTVISCDGGGGIRITCAIS